MLLRTARAALYVVPPLEVLLLVVLVAGMPLPTPVVVAAEAAAAAVLALELLVACRLYHAERRGGAGRRAALSATVAHLVPPLVRRLLEFEVKGLAAIALFAVRRRPIVPPGAVVAPYAREQAPMLLVMVFLMAVETACVDLLLVSLDVPAAVRITVLALDVYGIVFALALGASCALRPHLVSADELRVRFGEYLDVRVPRALISSVRQARNYNEGGMVSVADGRLVVAVSSQTNVVVELAEPVTVTRPLGGRAEVRAIRLFAADPAAVVRALRAPAVTA